MIEVTDLRCDAGRPTPATRPTGVARRLRMRHFAAAIVAFALNAAAPEAFANQIAAPLVSGAEGVGAAGDAYRAVVGRTDSTWVIGVEGVLPEAVTPGFAVLVVDPTAGAQGVILYEGPPIPGAPVVGQVHFGTTVVPLHGLRTPVAPFQEGRCPMFPDSLRT